MRLIFDCEPLFQKLRFWFEYSLECGIVFQLAEVLLQDQQENIPSLPRLPVAVGPMLTGKLVPMALNCMFWLLTVLGVYCLCCITLILTHREMNGHGFHISIRNSFKANVLHPIPVLLISKLNVWFNPNRVKTLQRIETTCTIQELNGKTQEVSETFALVSLIPGRPMRVLRIPGSCPNQNKTKISADNSPNFFNESAWKNDLKELLNEINE